MKKGGRKNALLSRRRLSRRRFVGLDFGAFLGFGFRLGFFRVLLRHALHETRGIKKANHAIGRRRTYQQPVLRALYQCASEEQMLTIGEIESKKMTSVQCYIGVRGSNNISEMGDVPADKMALYEKHWWTQLVCGTL